MMTRPSNTSGIVVVRKNFVNLQIRIIFRVFNFLLTSRGLEQIIEYRIEMITIFPEYGLLELERPVSLSIIVVVIIILFLMILEMRSPIRQKWSMELVII